MKKVCELYCGFGNDHGDVFYLGDTFSGEIEIIPKQDLEIVHFGYDFIKGVRGKIITSEEKVFTEYLLKSSILKQGEVYKFTISVKYNGVGNFTGKNIKFVNFLRFFIKTKEKVETPTSSKILTKIVNVFQNRTLFTEDIYLTYAFKKPVYTIKSAKQILKRKHNLFLIFIVLFFIALFVIFSLKNINPILCYAGVGLSAICLLTYYFLTKFLLGSIFIHYQNLGGKKISIHLNSQKRWRFVDEITTRFFVQEEVIDRRGTSTETIVETIFTSNPIHKKNPLNEESFTFELPDNLPKTIHTEDVNIKWIALVNIKLLWGISMRFENEFFVDKGNG